MTNSISLLLDADANPRFPAGYNTSENFSFNYQMMKLWLSPNAICNVKGSVMEVTFPWREKVQRDDFQEYFSNACQDAIDFMTVITDVVGQHFCSIIYVEIDVESCRYGLATTKVGNAFHLLQEMVCPATFAAPKIENSDLTVGEYIEAQFSPDE